MNALTKQLENQLSEDVMELVIYLQSENPDIADKLTSLIEDSNQLNKLELLILQLSRVYGICAFEEPDDLNIFKDRIQSITQSNRLFNDVATIYFRNISLNEINYDIKQSSFEFQTERLQQFIHSCLD